MASKNTDHPMQDNSARAARVPGRREKIVELIEVDGKKVSKTSTGKRKFHNKSKNGCLNCKRRRVKCDEGKPACTKCRNMSLECVYRPLDTGSGSGIAPDGIPSRPSSVMSGTSDTASVSSDGLAHAHPPAAKVETVIKYMRRGPDGKLEPDTELMNAARERKQRLTPDPAVVPPTSANASASIPGTNAAPAPTVKLENNDISGQFLKKAEDVTAAGHTGVPAAIAAAMRSFPAGDATSPGGTANNAQFAQLAQLAQQYAGTLQGGAGNGLAGMIPSFISSTLAQASPQNIQQLTSLLNNTSNNSAANVFDLAGTMPFSPGGGIGGLTSQVVQGPHQDSGHVPMIAESVVSPGKDHASLAMGQQVQGAGAHSTVLGPSSLTAIAGNLNSMSSHSHTAASDASDVSPSNGRTAAPTLTTSRSGSGSGPVPAVQGTSTLTSPKQFAAGPTHAQQQLQYQLHQQLQLQQHQQLQLQHDQQLQSQHQQLQLQQRQLLQQLLNQDENQLQQQAAANAQAMSQPLPTTLDQSIIPSQIQQQLQQQQTTQPGELQLPLQEESLSQLSKMGLNLKILGNLPTAGIGGIAYDFQELLGLKFNNAPKGPTSSHTSKDSTAEAILSDIQEQERVHKEVIKGNQDPHLAKDKTVSTPDLTNLVGTPSANTLPMMAQLSPMIKNALEGTLAGAASPTAALLAGRELSPSKHKPMVSGDDSMNGKVSGANKQDSEPQTEVARLLSLSTKANLNLVDMMLFHHYCTEVCSTITTVSVPEVWSKDVPALAFHYPFLMHSLLAFSATHLSRTEPGLEQYVSSHRLDALRLLREAVLEISEENTDALVASALILIMDSLANASAASASPSVNTMASSAWIFHVKGAATILTAVWPLSENSRFHDLISVDLSDLGDVINKEDGTISELVCFDESIADLYPVDLDSPYLITLAYLDKLNREINDSDFILRIFSFPALLDKTFLALLMTGDLNAMRIMRSYYKLLRGFTTNLKDKVWFLEGLAQVLPQDVDEYSGGGGMHMMLDFLGGGLPSMTTTNFSDFM